MNLRREARAKTLAKWKAQGPAIIERPRKLVRALVHPGFPEVRVADLAAECGDGATVTAIARQVLR